MKYLLMALIVLGAAAGAGAWYVKSHAQPDVVFRTAEVSKGDLSATISATGTAEPEEVVDVGAQVAGQILYFGKDKNGKIIDYDSQVETGTVLAQIDDSLYAADVKTAQATLMQTQAAVTQAQANLLQAQAALFKADRDWVRAQKLGPSEALAQTDYDGYQSTYLTAKAAVAVDQAAILAAQANVSQSQAALDKANKNEEYCTITSPVKGVIIDRRVNIGETVVSSLDAPSLFLIAKDLHRMQIWVSVNEADIGNIHVGQEVTFSVDAFPGQTFVGHVGQVRLNAAMTQNVVTYTVEIDTDNSSGKLLPYLTCNVQFQVAKHQGVLQVPNAALRWVPAQDEVDQTATAAASASSENAAVPAAPVPGGTSSSDNTSGQAPATQPAATDNQPPAAENQSDDAHAHHHTHSGRHDGQGDGSSRGVVWVLTPENLVRPVEVRVGVTDGINTEIRGKDIHQGDVVVIGEERQEDNQGTTNPFLPQMHRGGSGMGSGSGKSH